MIRIPPDIIVRTKYIKLTFLDLKLEVSSSCSYDKLEIYNGEEVRNNLLNSFCGDILPPPVYASKGQMVVKFVSDATFTAKGFSATFNFTSLSG